MGAKLVKETPSRAIVNSSFFMLVRFVFGWLVGAGSPLGFSTTHSQCQTRPNPYSPGVNEAVPRGEINFRNQIARLVKTL
jgi:hypothetical protein